jgi:regulator of protease activity HflC (stomatin/prohibitin superfamily)
MSPFGSHEEGQPLVTSASVVRSRAPRENNTGEDVVRHITLCACGVVLLVFTIVAIVALFEFSFIVPPGEVGVVITLGHVESYGSGLHFRVPFVSRLELMSAKIQILEENNIVPTKEGLAVTLDTAVLFRLNTTLVSQLYREIGPDYIRILIEPEAASAVRGLTSESDAKALYSSGRNLIQNTVKEELSQKLGSRGIIIEDVLLKDIKLPDELSKAIEAKVQAEQAAAQMEFVLKKETQEAERKAIEAKGVADFQRIVSEGISPELLKWKGVSS